MEIIILSLLTIPSYLIYQVLVKPVFQILGMSL